MTHRQDSDALLETYLRAARDHPEPPGADLLARVLADAETAQAGLAAAPCRARQTTRQTTRQTMRRATRPDLAGILRAIGGWPAATGLSAATLAGLWIGVAAPEGLAAKAGGLMGGGDSLYVFDLDPGVGFGFVEEAS